MDRPTLSVICPTTGRESLERTLRSLLLQQSSLTYEIVVVGDTYVDDQGDFRLALDTVPALLERLRHDFPFHYRDQPALRCYEHDGGEHIVGQPQRQYGMTVAKGRWLSWLGDDDIYLPGAFEAIRTAIDSLVQPVPLLFRWISPWKQLYWHTPGFYGEVPGHIDAECIVTPNIPAKLGQWGRRYQGDYDFIASTIKLHGGQVVFRPEIIAQARPSDAEDWTKQAAEVAGVTA